VSTVILRFYAELNDFLPPERRQRDFALGFRAPAPVRHLIELCGVPHTEVELIIRGDESIDLETAIADGERVAVYPVFEAFDIRPVLRLLPGPKRILRFLADAHLGALARRLRMLGFDTRWHNDLGDAALVELGQREHRILLTSDRRLLMRRAVTHGCLIKQASPHAQLAYLVGRLQLCAEIVPFSRCLACNGDLVAIDREAVHALVPPRVWASYRHYWRCLGCERVYWQGTHWAAMCRQIEDLCLGCRQDGPSEKGAWEVGISAIPPK